MEKDLVCTFVEVLSQLKVLHWQTESFARHMAYDRIYKSMGDHVDGFIEAYQGKYKRIRVVCQPKILNINDNINAFVDENINFLTNGIFSYISEEDVDLLAIRDEMVKELNTLKYLLTLK